MHHCCWKVLCLQRAFLSNLLLCKMILHKDFCFKKCPLQSYFVQNAVYVNYFTCKAISMQIVFVWPDFCLKRSSWEVLLYSKVIFVQGFCLCKVIFVERVFAQSDICTKCIFDVKSFCVKFFCTTSFHAKYNFFRF